MGTHLTVWVYDSPMGAAAGELRLRGLLRRGVLTVVDASTLTWIPGMEQPRLGRLRFRPTRSTETGLEDWLGRLRGAGVEDVVLDDIRGRLEPGTSALVVLARDVDLDVVRPFVERGIARGDVTLVHTSLRDDIADRLALELGAPGPRPDA